jgi:hypothetical protein
VTHIPDDVVERAANAYGDASGDHYDCLRAALRIAVEWEREQCAKVAEQKRIAPTNCHPALVADLRSDRIAAAIRARSNPSATE